MSTKNITFAMKEFIGKEVTIKVRLYGRYLTGIFKAFDKYSNIYLTEVKEFALNDDGEYILEAEYPSALVRGDSIINIALNQKNPEETESPFDQEQQEDSGQ